MSDPSRAVPRTTEAREDASGHTGGAPGRWAARLATVRRLSGLLVTAISLSLKVLSFRRVLGLVRRLSPPAGVADHGARTAERATEVARVSAIACRHTPLSNSCLHRSLALWWLLRRRGIDAELRIGARQEHGTFEAHAWVEYAHRIVGDEDPDHRYVTLTRTQSERDS
jgi:Transglutaminase-like superfamily